MDYKIVIARDEHASEAKKELEGKVKKLLSSGWELQGGVSVSVVEVGYDDEVIMAQAMVK